VRPALHGEQGGFAVNGESIIAAREKNEQVLAALSIEQIYGPYVELKPNGSNEKGLCPLHSESTASFFVYDDKHFHCFGCLEHGSAFDFLMKMERIEYREARARLAAMAGISLNGFGSTAGNGNHMPQPRPPAPNGNHQRAPNKGPIVAVYDYVDENGKLLFQTVRHDPKDFSARRPDGNGGSISKLGNVRRVLYWLPEILAADEVLAVEGEKDCNSARSLGFVATCNPFGAGKWRKEFSEVLRGKNVIIVADADEPGRKHAQEVATSLWWRAASIKVIELPGAKDLTEWLERGGTREALLDLIRDKPEWKPSDAAEPLNVETAGGTAAPESRSETVDGAPLLNNIKVEARMPWPNPAPLGDDLPPVTPFSLEFLPASFRPLVVDIAERMQVPMDFPGIASIVALAGCVNRRAMIQPKAIDVSWSKVPNLWGALIGPPGFMKSPVLRTITLPLTQIEELWRSEYSAASSEYEAAKEQAELRHQAWREDFKRALKKDKPSSIQHDGTISVPVCKRLVLTDATCEKLHEILAENPAGVLVVRDELTGWLAQLERQGRETERAFLLQSWNGDTPFAMDRIGRGSIYVPAVCVSLIGNIQPARLRCYLSDALAGGPSDDGLFQRFQLLVWPDPPKRWELVDRRPDARAIAVTEKVFSSLANLSAESPVSMRFASDAQELFFAWLTELEGKIRGEHGLSPFLVAHLSKYRSLMPSLAALFELADRAARESESLTGEVSVSLDHAKQAKALCDYLEFHAHRVYACVASPECHAARELARHIQHGDFPPIFSTRSVYLKGWSGLGTPERVRGALEVLADAAWVRPVETAPSATGGRPREAWAVNPKVQNDAE
jgi:hypothetical protein